MTPPWYRWLQWHVARTLFGLHALAGFPSRRIQTFIEVTIWPEGFSREAPPWAIR